MSVVTIRYTRLPDRITVFRQQFIAREGDCTITLLERTQLEAPVRSGSDVILEPDAPALWFTFDGAWHDIGRFHTTSGGFTGWYANVITPVEHISDHDWSVTDLFLDVWLDASGRVSVLDADELEAALAAGTIDDVLAAAARREALRLAAGAANGSWPPQVARDWTLQRAREVLRQRPKPPAGAAPGGTPPGGSG